MIAYFLLLSWQSHIMCVYLQEEISEFQLEPCDEYYHQRYVTEISCHLAMGLRLDEHALDPTKTA